MHIIQTYARFIELNTSTDSIVWTYLIGKRLAGRVAGVDHREVVFFGWLPAPFC